MKKNISLLVAIALLATYAHAAEESAPTNPLIEQFEKASDERDIILRGLQSNKKATADQINDAINDNKAHLEGILADYDRRIILSMLGLLTAFYCIESLIRAIYGYRAQRQAKDQKTAYLRELEAENAILKANHSLTLQLKKELITLKDLNEAIKTAGAAPKPARTPWWRVW